VVDDAKKKDLAAARAALLGEGNGRRSSGGKGRPSRKAAKG
jgi:hypothetical protein